MDGNAGKGEEINEKCEKLTPDEISRRKCVPEYCQVVKFTDSNGHVKELIFPKGLDLDRPKRARTAFSEYQLKVLEEEFQRNQYVVGSDRTELAKSLQLSEIQVKVWFQNRRTKLKRDKNKKNDVSFNTLKLFKN